MGDVSIYQNPDKDPGDDSSQWMLPNRRRSSCELLHHKRLQEDGGCWGQGCRHIPSFLRVVLVTSTPVTWMSITTPSYFVEALMSSFRSPPIILSNWIAFDSFAGRTLRKCYRSLINISWWLSEIKMVLKMKGLLNNFPHQRMMLRIYVSTPSGTAGS